MKNRFALFCFISTLSLVACNKNGQTKVEYSEFYQKIQEIEENHHSHATLDVTYFDDLSGERQTMHATLNYSWNDEQNKYIPDETYEFDLSDEINRTIKDEFKKAEESEDSKNLGYQYFINPFKCYVDFTEKMYETVVDTGTMEERTIRTIESQTYNSYGYLTDYLLQATVNGTYKGEPLNGTQKTTYSISYK